MTTFQAGMIDMESNTTLVQCYPAHQAIPAGEGPFPAVLVLHDRFGLTSHARNVTNRLARAGFYALAPDLYAMPSGFSDVARDLSRIPKPTFFEKSDANAARERASTLNDERGLAVVQQAIAYVAGRSKARSGGVALIGFSMGARLAFLSACAQAGDIRAASCFYPEGLGQARPPSAGNLPPLARIASIQAPLLIFYGLLDMEIRPDEREAVRQSLAAAGKDYRIEVLPGAGHDFFCEERETYRIRASRLAWEETIALFQSRLA
jgi:carboxymethylenebutenolidase